MKEKTAQEILESCPDYIRTFHTWLKAASIEVRDSIINGHKIYRFLVSLESLGNDPLLQVGILDIPPSLRDSLLLMGICPGGFFITFSVRED